MKILFLSILLMAGLQASADVIKSSTSPASVQPGSITFFDDAIMTNTYVSTVASLVGGAWLHQQVSVSIGYLEEGRETFTVDVVGEVLNSWVSEAPNGDLRIAITTGTGPFNPDEGEFEEGYTKYYLFVKADQNDNTDHGYLSEAELTTSSFSSK